MEAHNRKRLSLCYICGGSSGGYKVNQKLCEGITLFVEGGTDFSPEDVRVPNGKSTEHKFTVWQKTVLIISRLLVRNHDQKAFFLTTCQVKIWLMESLKIPIINFEIKSLWWQTRRFPKPNTHFYFPKMAKILFSHQNYHYVYTCLDTLRSHTRNVYEVFTKLRHKL